MKQNTLPETWTLSIFLPGFFPGIGKSPRHPSLFRRHPGFRGFALVAGSLLAGLSS
jgi:hypothetical protein